VGAGPKSKYEFVSASYTFYTHNLKIVLYNFLLYLCFNCKLLHEVREFSTCSIMSVPKKFKILEHFVFYSFRLGMLSLHRTHAFMHSNIIFPYFISLSLFFSYFNSSSYFTTVGAISYLK
jgi:hypothetical protein